MIAGALAERTPIKCIWWNTVKCSCRCYRVDGVQSFRVHLCLHEQMLKRLPLFSLTLWGLSMALKFQIPSLQWHFWLHETSLQIVDVKTSQLVQVWNFRRLTKLLDMDLRHPTMGRSLHIQECNSGTLWIDSPAFDNWPWYVPNAIIPRYLQVPSVKEEIRRLSAQHYAGLCTHPNLLATQLSRHLLSEDWGDTCDPICPTDSLCKYVVS
jgi:hypothetical protein